MIESDGRAASPPSALPRRRTTLADVAKHAGVSKATASLVLRDVGRVSAETRERVRASMQALGYVYHRGAASLRAHRTQTVGLIVSDVSNGFNAELAIGLENALARVGTVTLTANAFEDPRRQDVVVRSMLERQVDGIVVIPAVGSDSTLLDDLAASHVPAVIAGRHLPHPDIPYVGIDNVAGGRLAGEHLAFHRVRRVGYLGGYAELGPRPDRVAGVVQALRESGHSGRLEIDLPGPPDGGWGLEAARRLLDEGTLPEALVCHNDLVAFGVYRALRELPSRRLRHIRVVSFDDVAESAWWEPPLTTVAASGREVGVRCAEVLLQLFAQPGARMEPTLITPRLVVRNSCGCALPRADRTARPA